MRSIRHFTAWFFDIDNWGEFRLAVPAKWLFWAVFAVTIMLAFGALASIVGGIDPAP